MKIGLLSIELYLLLLGLGLRLLELIDNLLNCLLAFLDFLEGGTPPFVDRSAVAYVVLQLFLLLFETERRSAGAAIILRMDWLIS